MLNIGSRSNPSVLNLVLIVIAIFVIADYVLVSLDTQDWSWFSNRFDDEFFYPTPRRVQSNDQADLKVDNLVAPVTGHYPMTDAVFVVYRGVPMAGSLQVDSIIPLKEYLWNQDIRLPAAIR